MFGLDLALVIGGGLVAGAWPDTPVFVPTLFAAMVASLGGVGAVIATRKPRDPVGWILLFSASMVTLSVSGEDYVRLSVTDFGGALPLTIATAWLEGLAFGPAVILLAGVMPLYFPDGRLPARRWRWVVWTAAFGIVAGILAPAFAPGPLANTAIDNPLGIPGFHDLDGLLALSNVLLGVVVLPLAIASTILKYRRGSSTIREQLKWFGAVALLTVAGFIGGAVGIAPISDVGGFLGIVGLVLLPIAIGIAILRYRLYEIDRIISRTVSYAVVTGILALMFVGTILVSQTVLASIFSGSSVAVAASTLVVAALFQPLRRRVQSIVDRRFNRSRYDAEKTVAAFAAHLRDEVALDRLEADIRGVVSLTLAPTTVSLWMRPQDART
ncbi:MAG: hypothetical protein ACXWXA_04720 [Candidatus Limnocylindrales bacterium]